MPLGTALLQSPGWNEVEARYETLGIHRQKRIELRRSGTHSKRLVCAFAFVGKVPPLWGSTNVQGAINPGLAPWAMQEYRPYRAPLRLLNQYTLLF